MKRFLHIVLACGAILGSARAAMPEDFYQLQQRLNDALLDIYAGQATAQTAQEIGQDWTALRANLKNADARRLVPETAPASSPDKLAAQIGAGRSLLQHIAALEMLEAQREGRVSDAQMWRSLITLPRFANADTGAVLLLQPPGQVRQANVSQALAREDINWQVSRARQLLDHFQEGIATGQANDAFLAAHVAEIQTLVRLPGALLTAAAIETQDSSEPAKPVVAPPFNTPEATAAIAGWRERVEATLPNLLAPNDVVRLERLLARFVMLVPKEYKNGVQNGIVVLPLELREATQFTQQAQSLVNELAPVWRRDHPEAYAKYHGELVQDFGQLQTQIQGVGAPGEIQADAAKIASILDDQFGLSARRSGAKGKVIEETVLEVRAALTASLAAAQSDQWQEAEAQRLDAYTAFDSEIEVRVLPRDPSLALRAERSFLDGQQEPGIKALLDRRAPMEELTAAYERTLKNLDDCAAMLKVSVSPGTLGFTAFSIISREGLEAVVILAALLAGLRGAENRSTRRGIAWGAGLGVLASLLTFWLSQTVIQSLIRYGEKLEAVVSVLAVIVLLIVTNWVFHKVYWVGWNARLRDLSKAAREVRAPRWEGLALLGVGFLTVYREGFETSIFMQSLLLEGSRKPVALGVGAGFIFIATIGVLIVVFGKKLPYRRLLVVTGFLVVSIMVTFLGSAVRLFQTVGWLPVHPIPSLNFPNWVGLWFGLYPSWEGLLIPPLALVYVSGAWLYVKWTSRVAQSEIKIHAIEIEEPSEMLSATKQH